MQDWHFSVGIRIELLTGSKIFSENNQVSTQYYLVTIITPVRVIQSNAHWVLEYFLMRSFNNKDIVLHIALNPLDSNLFYY